MQVALALMCFITLDLSDFELNILFLNTVGIIGQKENHHTEAETSSLRMIILVP